MATYFPGSDNERDTSTMLHLRESLSSSYSNAPVFPGNLMMYMNCSSSSGSYSGALAENSQNHSSSITNLLVASSSKLSERENLGDLGGPQIGEHVLNEWKNGGNSMPLMYPGRDAVGTLQNPQNMQIQALSLTLSTQVPSGFQASSLRCTSPNHGYSSLLSANPSVPAEGSARDGYFEIVDGSLSKQSSHIDYVSPDFPGNDSTFAFGMPSIARAVPKSKYLKAAQLLLDEVVNVKRALREQNPKNGSTKDSKESHGDPKNGESDHRGSGSLSNAQESGSNPASELSAAERHDLQNKMSKLLAMMEEVDKRYRQYYHQMQIVVSSFDTIAGYGAAKPYTALALQTISRHFRSLRDAINEQVQVTRRSLGEQDTSTSSQAIGISRLRYVDHQIKQQRALQQLGVMQQHAWRPQRGLPECSVTVLRAWLFEHFLHPYPKDSDKIMLARQTGLTRNQVSNWFINARVRLWKPMVEEMYKEENVDADMESNSSSDVAAKTVATDPKESEDRREDILQCTTSAVTERCGGEQLLESKSDYFPDVEMMEQIISRPFHNEYTSSLPDSAINQSLDSSGRYLAAAYHMSELERFENGRGVSLTLGLQHSDGGTVPVAIGTHPNYIRTDAQAAEFDSGNQQNRFGSSQTLHDFVA